MGAYLSQPITEKETQDGADDSGLRWGAAGMQGWRTGMEDSHMVCLDLNGESSEERRSGADVSSRGEPVIAAFAVFDGHGGGEVAKYCSAHICTVARETPGYKEGNLGLGLKQTFLRMDELLRSPSGQAELRKLKEEDEGSKAAHSDSEDDGDMGMLSKMNKGAQLNIMEYMKKAMSEKFRSEGIVLEGSGGDAGGSDDDSDDSSEGEKQADGKGTENKEASTSGGDTEGSESHDAAGVTPEADKLEGDGESGPVSTKECAVLLNGSAPHAGAVQPSATVDSSAVPAGPAGDGEGSSGSATEGVGIEERKKDKGDSGGEEWSNAALKLEVEEAEAPGLDLALDMRRRCGYDCGATAVMGLLVGGKTLVIANAGDSRCVVSRKGVAIDMSTDHKPEDELELTRIEKAGGAVVDGRVQGNLNLSRAIGDLMYKVDESLSPEEQMITADPELQTLEITDEDEFIVLACDGVWNSLSSQETVNFVRERMRGSASTSHPTPLSSVCADLCDACCAETADGDGTGLDNVTVILIELNTVGAGALSGRGARGPTSSGEEAFPGTLEAESSGDMDMSDDGKRKQGDGGGAKERSGKQMRPAVEAVAEGEG